ncbi:MAG: putative transcriptional regulator of the TetR family [Blastococcus sp.]|nr:putative transcriptional regulator of the TetR family [Blastococcus sp.]
MAAEAFIYDARSPGARQGQDDRCAAGGGRGVTHGGAAAQPERRTQAERRAATRSALVQATVECLVELGYARTTTQEVQTRAGVSRGALTHQFTTKAELVVAAVDHLYEGFGDSVRKAAASLPADPGSRVRLGIEMVWERFHGPLFVAAMELWGAARTDAELRAALLPHEQRLGQQLRGLAADVFGEPLARHPSSEAAYQVLLTSMRGQAMTYALQPDAPRSGPHVQHWVTMVEALARPATSVDAAAVDAAAVDAVEGTR